MPFSPLDKAIIRELQGNIPLEPRPFLRIAQRLDIPEEMLLEKIREFREKGYIRRFGAALRHREMGLKANPMIVWRVPEQLIDIVGRKIAAYPQVTHCYHRPPLPKFPYNLFSMIHSETEEECFDLAAKISRETGITEYQLLFSTAELKKTSMKYFME